MNDELIKVVQCNNVFKVVNEAEDDSCLANGRYSGHLVGVPGLLHFSIVGGKICGRIVMFYPNSAQPCKIIELMINGIINGLVTEFWINGELKSQAVYNGGYIDGVEYCYACGLPSALVSISSYKCGIPEGFVHTYYNSLYVSSTKFVNNNQVSIHFDEHLADDVKVNPYKRYTLSKK